ncbi:hypothetical protein H696_05811 [Fonticula alba]|uniref:U3 small nucleolar RNA-associated protein 6 N-terminal domain-containing protein n=1 Tax=Fonticula alba TaxID=691883 RepID=A0A058Z184_FONAL|nr:hypothetical protein H696_05811 [Fonticula alba]KCV67703.1 hypothetical protein H696_05811 [Fonticula alba]|eukprot:XP_009497887.1 hypothetical protein H696_05811 [Fonticula alba]
MAENVHSRLEVMVPDLKQFIEIGYFTPEEVRAIVKKRTDFEYKLRRRIPVKLDYLRYIQYEMNLESLRAQRKQRLGLYKHNPVDYAITNNITTIFDRAMMRFSGDTRLWVDYIRFLLAYNRLDRAAGILSRAVLSRPTEPLFWIMAASFELDKRSNFDTARALLQRGARLNRSNDVSLWVEYLRLETLFIERIRARRAMLGLSRPGVADPEAAAGQAVSVPELPQETGSTGDGGSDSDAAQSSDESAAGGGPAADEAMSGIIALSSDVTRSAGAAPADAAGQTDAQKASLAHVLSGAIPKMIIKSAFEAHPESLALRIRFMEILRSSYGHRLTECLDMVYESLQNDFPFHPHALTLVIRREVDRLLFVPPQPRSSESATALADQDDPPAAPPAEDILRAQVAVAITQMEDGVLSLLDELTSIDARTICWLAFIDSLQDLAADPRIKKLGLSAGLSAQLCSSMLECVSRGDLLRPELFSAWADSIDLAEGTEHAGHLLAAIDGVLQGKFAASATAPAEESDSDSEAEEEEGDDDDDGSDTDSDSDDAAPAPAPAPTAGQLDQLNALKVRLLVRGAEATAAAAADSTGPFAPGQVSDFFLGLVPTEALAGLKLLDDFVPWAEKALPEVYTRAFVKDLYEKWTFIGLACSEASLLSFVRWIVAGPAPWHGALLDLSQRALGLAAQPLAGLELILHHLLPSKQSAQQPAAGEEAAPQRVAFTAPQLKQLERLLEATTAALAPGASGFAMLRTPGASAATGTLTAAAAADHHQSTLVRGVSRAAAVWLKWIAFELAQGNPKRVISLYERAVRSVPDADAFVQAYNRL